MENKFKFLKGNIETIILNALYNGDKYGYEIAKEIKEKTENKYEIKQPTLYTYLKRLQEQELVESYWGDESFGGRRKYFKLTAKGKTACEKYMSEWNFHRTILDSLVADPIRELPEYIPDDNLFLGSKTVQKKKHQKKDFSNEKENQLLFEQLLKLTEKNNDEIISTSNSATNCIEDITCATTNLSNPILGNIASSNNETNQDEYICNTPIIERTQESSVSTIDLIRPTISDSDKNNDAIILNDEDLLRITDCDEKFTPQIKQHTDKIFNEVNNDIDIARDIHQDISQLQPVQHATVDIAESTQDNQYKVILGSLLGEQIVNTDEKIANINPQATNCREEIFYPNLTITETADNLSKEGYRIRFYNTATSQYRAVPMLIKNKINCITAWTTLCVFYILLGLSLLLCGLNANLFIFGLIALGFLLIPLFYTYIYITKPNIRIKSSHNFRHSILKRVVIFIFASALILCIDLLMFRIDFSDILELTYKLILPEIVLFMLIVSECLYNFYLKRKQFYS